MDKEIIDFVLAIIQIVTLVVLIIYVWKTWEMASATRKAAESARDTVSEMKTAREAEFRPYVVAYFEIVRHIIIRLVVMNSGRSEARDISVIFDPDLQATDGEKVRNILSHSFTKFSLQPQQELTTYVDQIGRYLADRDFPKSYKVMVRYQCGGTGKSYEDLFNLDLGVYKGLLVLDEKDLPAMVDELRKIKGKATSIADSLRTLANVRRP